MKKIILLIISTMALFSCSSLQTSDVSSFITKDTHALIEVNPRPLYKEFKEYIDPDTVDIDFFSISTRIYGATVGGDLNNSEPYFIATNIKKKKILEQLKKSNFNLISEEYNIYYKNGMYLHLSKDNTIVIAKSDRAIITLIQDKSINNHLLNEYNSLDKKSQIKFAVDNKWFADSIYSTGYMDPEYKKILDEKNQATPDFSKGIINFSNDINTTTAKLEMSDEYKEKLEYFKGKLGNLVPKENSLYLNFSKEDVALGRKFLKNMLEREAMDYNKKRYINQWIDSMTGEFVIAFDSNEELVNYLLIGKDRNLSALVLDAIYDDSTEEITQHQDYLTVDFGFYNPNRKKELYTPKENQIAYLNAVLGRKYFDWAGTTFVGNSYINGDTTINSDLSITIKNQLVEDFFEMTKQLY